MELEFQNIELIRIRSDYAAYLQMSACDRNFAFLTAF